MRQPRMLILIIVFLLMQFPGCTGADNAFFYRAMERGDVDIVLGRAGLIRTVYCDIYVEHVDEDGWNYIKEYPFFRGRGRRNPSVACFHFVVINTWNKPFRVEKVEAICSGTVIQPEDYSFIKDPGYLENRYSVNIKSLFKNRRIISENYLLKDIDFENDTTDYRLDFFAPGDRISFFRFFSWFPVEKSSKIRITIKYFDMKKVIDFDIGRFEYNETMLY